MPAVHCETHTRACGATTIVTGQSTVRSNNLLWSVQGDPNTDGNGGLIASGSTVRINNIPIIVIGDSANPDDLCIPLGGPHCNPSAASGSSNVSCY
jgi:uncharacterized Zn-binding protein involved in type VI secretion